VKAGHDALQTHHRGRSRTNEEWGGAPVVSQRATTKFLTFEDNGADDRWALLDGTGS
jgi:hypothetical protein